MNIAIFSDIFFPELSGISDSIITTSRALRKRGHTLTFVVPKYGADDFAVAHTNADASPLQSDDIVHTLPSFHYPSPTLQGRVALPFLPKTMKANSKFDIVHAHTFFGAGIAAKRFARAHNIPFVGTNHTLIEAFSAYAPIKSSRLEGALKRYVIRFYNRCDSVTVPSAFLATDMQQSGLTAPIEILSNPIGNEFFAQPAEKSVLRSTLNISGFTFLYVGRLSDEKRVITLLDTFVAFAKTHQDASLIFVGEGALRKTLAEQIVREKLNGRVRIVGPYIGEDKKMLYDYVHAADVFIMPSTSETQSMTTMQAMAAGLPVIVANHGPLPELTSGAGLTFAADDKNSLFMAMEKLYQEPELVRTLGEKGREIAKQMHEDEIARVWEEYYILKSRHA